MRTAAGWLGRRAAGMNLMTLAEHGRVLPRLVARRERLIRCALNVRLNQHTYYHAVLGLVRASRATSAKDSIPALGDRPCHRPRETLSGGDLVIEGSLCLFIAHREDGCMAERRRAAATLCDPRRNRAPREGSRLQLGWSSQQVDRNNLLDRDIQRSREGV